PAAFGGAAPTRTSAGRASGESAPPKDTCHDPIGVTMTSGRVRATSPPKSCDVANTSSPFAASEASIGASVGTSTTRIRIGDAGKVYGARQESSKAVGQ